MEERPRLSVVTGASAGLGAVFAEKLAARGSGLLLAARRADRLGELKARLESRFGVAVEVHAADLSDPRACEAFAGRLASEPRVDLLVNNAGFGTLGAFWETDYQRQETMHRLHVAAVMRLTRAVLPRMIARGEGAIINVASVAGFFRSAGNVSYCATKGWMCDFSEALRWNWTMQTRRWWCRRCVRASPARSFTKFWCGPRRARQGLVDDGGLRG